MLLQGKKARTLMLAGIPFLALPLVAESGMFRDRSQRDNERSSYSDARSSSGERDIVQGEISRKEGDKITLRTTDGERISFKINDQTRQFCPEGGMTSQTPASGQRTGLRSDSSMAGSGQQQGSDTSGMGQSSPSGIGQTSSGVGQSSGGMNQGSAPGSGQQHDSQSLSGMSQRSSMSGQSQTQESSGGTQQEQEKAGLMFGDCRFEKGEFVKAKLDQDGNATFVRSWGSDDENYFRAGRSGENYFVLPAGQLGGLDISDKKSGYSVESSDGKKIGHIHKIMTSSRGDVSYAIVKKDDGQLISLPWQALEGSGDKTFKVNVSKTQLGNLPVLEERESPVQHVQRNWDLSDEGQSTRYDSEYGNDQGGESFYSERYGVRQSRFESDRGHPQRGPRQGVRGDRYDYDRDNRQSRDDREYPQLGSRPGVAGERGAVSIFGSPSTLPPGEHAPQYTGADREGSFDQNRQSRSSDDFRHRRGGGQYDPQQKRSFDRDRQTQYSDRERPDWHYEGYQSRMDREQRYMDPLSAPRYDRGGYDQDRRQSRSFDQSRQGRFSERNRQDRFSDDSRNRREGDTYDRYQSRRSGSSGDRDYRPEPYRP